MIDILIGFAFDHRMTLGERTIESAWTISILSPSLSWLDTSAIDMKDVVHNAIRRMLAFPYIRQYYFAQIVLNDVVNMLRMGRRCLLRNFLLMYDIFEHSETQYLLNILLCSARNVVTRSFSGCEGVCALDCSHKQRSTAFT